MKDKLKILLIGDSFGCERYLDKNAVVLGNETWPVMVKDYFKDSQNIKFEINFKPFRLLSEVIEIIYNNRNMSYDFIIIHAGIVDIFPRPLPKSIFRSKNIFAKILRKIISHIRIFWLKNIYSKPMNDIKYLKKQINNLPNTKLLFISLSKQYYKEVMMTPNINYLTNSFNDLIVSKSDKISNCDYIDLVAYNNKYYYILDSHFNKEGNEIIFKLVSEYVENKCL